VPLSEGYNNLGWLPVLMAAPARAMVGPVLGNPDAARPTHAEASLPTAAVPETNVAIAEVLAKNVVQDLGIRAAQSRPNLLLG